ncbi:hypothetical protein JRC04_07170 [Mycolicibacterium sp. S2-37]|uniref:hypothetical protein n=1 Tax=Mycolicibacterium sp. S2-37 TaxID=2810297 RepID=UPI001A948B85|nr:hypothetical protein [Mycolicibacterium sp. S2-37]MBO0677240.1 hypothetical protein [Mycolicibacterium sp. S2-37]
MSTPKRSSYVGRRRAEDLPVRRWLQLGAASAGMGAALIGWSLVGSEVGVANADSGVESSSSAGPAATPAKGVDSGSTAASPSGRAGTAASREDADAPSPTSRTVNRTVANDADTPSPRVVSRADRAAAAETSSVAGQRSSATTPPAKPTATTNREVAEILQDPGTQILGGGGAGPAPVVTAGVRDGLGAAAKLLGQGVKDALSSRPLQNFLQNQGPPLPGLLDLIPKTRYTVPEDPIRKAVREAQEAEAKREQDANSRRINEIVEKGVKLTASDGSPVYTVDGETFVKYDSSSGTTYGDKYTPNPPTPRLVTLRSGPNQDRNIRRILRVDPAQVRNSLPRQPSMLPSPFSGPTFSWSNSSPLYVIVGGAPGGFRSPFG